MDDPVEVAQKVNPAPRIQRLLDALDIAPTRFKAAILIARLHATLAPLHEQDSQFQAEWGDLLGGRFVDVASKRSARRHIQWSHVWSAQKILLGVMERHGMGFQALLPDELEQEVEAILPELNELIRRSSAAEKAAQLGLEKVSA
jgi:hypothetical protein